MLGSRSLSERAVASVRSRAGSLVCDQPHVTFSEIYADALKALRNPITAARQRAASTPA
jgi:hypothetical protein